MFETDQLCPQANNASIIMLSFWIIIFLLSGPGKQHPAVMDRLSPDELRKTLFQTFKDKGVCDKLTVSHTTLLLSVVRVISPDLRARRLLVLIPCVSPGPSDSGPVSKSVHSGLQTPIIYRSWICTQSSTCQIWTNYGVCLQQHSSGSSQDLWTWVYPFCILPWKWPMQRQGEHLWCFSKMYF